MATSSRRPFGRLPDGSDAYLYFLESPPGLRVAVTELGGAIVSLWAPDREGRAADVVLGYDHAEGYAAGKSHFGALVGRYGNRIANGSFTLDGKNYQLPLNNGANHLHGGPRGFDRVVWQVESATLGGAAALRLSYFSRDGEEGYPGNLQVEVLYSLPTPDTLRIDYRAETDRPTPVNLTNHSYFNLGGQGSSTVLDHELSLLASQFTPVGPGLIPTGEWRAVAGTPLDFRQPHRIGERIDQPDEQLALGPGYDHNFVIDRHSLAEPELAARVFEPRSGRVMEVLTTEPGLQFYSGNFLDGTQIGKGGAVYARRSALCLETQHFPDSPNHPSFPNTILRPGEQYRSSTLYRFSTR